MSRLRWVVVLLALADAVYMTVDGTRALTKGDYITPASGDHAGELGPWALVVEKVGIAPRSTGVKTFFVVYGVAWIGVVVAFALKTPWAWTAMLLFALGSIWYLTVGTAISVVVSLLLLVPAVRDVYAGTMEP